MFLLFIKDSIVSVIYKEKRGMNWYYGNRTIKGSSYHQRSLIIGNITQYPSP